MPKKTEETNKIEAQVSFHDFYTQIPNMISRGIFDHYEIALYVYYCQWAFVGNNQVGLRTISDTIKMGVEKIRKTRDQLIQKGFIIMRPPSSEEISQGFGATVILVDVWDRNRDFFRKKIPVLSTTRGDENNTSEGKEKDTRAVYDTEAVLYNAHIKDIEDKDHLNTCELKNSLADGDSPVVQADSPTQLIIDGQQVDFTVIGNTAMVKQKDMVVVDTADLTTNEMFVLFSEDLPLKVVPVYQYYEGTLPVATLPNEVSEFVRSTFTITPVPQNDVVSVLDAVRANLVGNPPVEPEFDEDDFVPLDEQNDVVEILPVKAKRGRPKKAETDKESPEMKQRREYFFHDLLRVSGKSGQYQLNRSASEWGAYRRAAKELRESRMENGELIPLTCVDTMYRLCVEAKWKSFGVMGMLKKVGDAAKVYLRSEQADQQRREIQQLSESEMAERLKPQFDDLVLPDDDDFFMKLARERGEIK